MSNNLKKLWYPALPLLVLPLMGFSQNQKEDPKFNLRGKAIYFFIIEDFWYGNATLGAEYRFAKNQSIGLDAFYLLKQEEDDREEQAEPQRLTQHYTLLADYRYYLFPEMAKRTGWELYLNSYLRYSNVTLRTDDDYTLETGEKTNGNAHIKDIGVALGTRKSFSPGKSIGVDFNIGLSYRNKTEDFTVLTDTGAEKMTDVPDKYWVGSVRLNLYLYFRKRRGIGQSTNPQRGN